MKRLNRSFALAAALLGITGAAGAQTVTTLPTLPGFYTYPLDVNNQGVAVGNAFSVALSDSEAVRWVDGQIEVLPGYDQAFATGINNAGVIVGGGRDVALGVNFPVVWENGVPRELPTLGQGGVAYGINNNGDVVGSVESATGTVPAVWRNNVLVLLPLLDGAGGMAMGIDDAGLLTGVSYGMDGMLVPTQWVMDQPSALPTSFGVNFIGVVSTSKTGAGKTSGFVVEGRTLENGDRYLIQVAVAWDEGGFRVLQRLNENGNSGASDVNAQGVFAGFTQSFEGRDIPTLWNQDGGTRLPYDPELCARAVGLNEQGLVIGFDRTDPSNPVPILWNLNSAPRVQMGNQRARPGATVTLSARALMGAEPMAGKTMTFQVDGVTLGTAVTDSSGTARRTYRVPSNSDGRLSVMASLGGTAYVFRAIEVSRNASSAGVSARFNRQANSLVLQTSLLSLESSQPLARRRVTFFVGGRQVATATTDREGRAQATVRMPSNLAPGQVNVEARFGGDSLNWPVRGRSSIVLR